MRQTLWGLGRGAGVPHPFAFFAKGWAGLDDATAQSGSVLGVPTLPKTGEGWGTPRLFLYSLKIEKRIPPLRRMTRFANHPTSVGMTVSLGSLIGTLRQAQGRLLKPCPDTSLLDSGRK
jgi:hypothetical protein